MSKSNTTENDLMEYIFKATAISWNGATDLYLALHTANPLDTGSQNSSEANYTGYARVAVSRSGSGWTVTGNQATNAALIQFPQCTGGSSICTHLSIGTAASGAGQILYYGELASALNVTNGIQPFFNAGTITVTED